MTLASGIATNETNTRAPAPQVMPRVAQVAQSVNALVGAYQLQAARAQEAGVRSRATREEAQRLRESVRSARAQRVSRIESP